MNNYELFVTDPRQASLPNQGVAEVGGKPDAAILASELGMFVCEGQYAKGLERILTGFLANAGGGKQQAAWVSGFYGSGKSHLVKVLRYLWTNAPLPNGRTPRDVTTLPQELRDQFRELDAVSRRHGGIFAAAGVLQGTNAAALPATILSIVYESLGLPPSPHIAEFVLWLKRQGLEDKVKADIAAANRDWSTELDSFLVSEDIATSIQRHSTALGKHADDVLDKLNAQFPRETVIDIPEMVKRITRTLKERFADQFPSTLIVLDEAQQYVGKESDRGYALQGVAEALCSSFQGRLMVVATGQSALNTIALLERLQDRFTIQIALQDNDIEGVIRKVVLEKKPDKKTSIQQLVSSCEGEITRQLQGTRIESKSHDKDLYVDNYPLLPVRQRFWETGLRQVGSGLTGQLRTQLRITLDAVKAIASRPLGTIIPADALFDQLAVSLQERAAIDRDQYNTITRLRSSANPDEALAGRLFALIFLIAKINEGNRDTPGNLGIRATAAVLADLLVEDLKAGGAVLRERVPKILKEQQEAGRLILVADEYRLQTPESASWEQGFLQQRAVILNKPGEIAHLRTTLLQTQVQAQIDDVALNQGAAKIKRRIETSFGQSAPTADNAVPVWVRTQWDVAEKVILNDAQAAGTSSPLVTVYIPSAADQELIDAIATAKAAELTLLARGEPGNLAAKEACDSMRTRKTFAESKIQELLMNTVIPGARVMLGGNDDVPGFTLAAKVKAACEAALARIYRNFVIGDSDRWEDVFKQAKAGDVAALKVLNFHESAERHPVCKAVLDEVGSGKRGSDVIKTFISAPYGWPQPAVTAALMTLLASGLIRATRNQQAVTRQAIEQGSMGPLDFRMDHPPISANDKMKLRRLYQMVGVKSTPADEEHKGAEFIAAAMALAQAAGGDAPAPECPSTAALKQMSLTTGNTQLAEILQAYDQLNADLAEWVKRRDQIAKRLPRWRNLEALLAAAKDLAIAATLRPQVDAIRQGRQLLDPTDPVPALCDAVAQSLRAAVTDLHGKAQQVHEAQAGELDGDAAWKTLGTKDRPARDRITQHERLGPPPSISVATEDELIKTVAANAISWWQDLIQLLPTRFANARAAAAFELEPKSQQVRLPSATIRTEADLAQWLGAAEKAIKAKLAEGPVIL
jgi:hypothetical protein